jgi:hypothetical protein
MGETDGKQMSRNESVLLGTIRVPKNMNNLGDKLPESKYNTGISYKFGRNTSESII